jgi:hypothetical protein
LILALLACPAPPETQDLGTITTDGDGLASVKFTVPDNGTSALAYCGAFGYDVLATANEVKSPGGASVYTYDAGGDGLRVGTYDDTLPLLVPMSPRLDVSAGDWTLQVLTDTPDVSMDCSAIFRVEAPSSSPVLDVAFVFVGVSEVNASTAKDDSTLQAAVAAMEDRWSDIGLKLGNVTYEDFGGDVDTYTTVDGYAEFGDLLKTAADGPTLTYFFVQDILLDSAQVLGLSAGPPGLASVGGTSKSGVIVSTVDWDIPDEIGHILAHEGGHFFGLFHTVEKDGAAEDLLDDTPVCDNDADANGTLNTDECGGTGAENVMWWTYNEDAVEMSDDQGWVIGRSVAMQ